MQTYQPVVTTPLEIEAYVGLTTASPEQFVTVGRGAMVRRIGPAAASIYMRDRIANSYSLQTFAGNPHFVYGLAVKAILNDLLMREVIRQEDGSWAASAFVLTVYCKNAGTSRYIERFIAKWKKQGGRRSNGQRPIDWPIWEELNALCSLGKLRFVKARSRHARGVVDGLYEDARYYKSQIPRMRTQTARLGYRMIRNRTYQYDITA